MSGDGWDELVGRLDEDDDVVGEAEWGTNFALQPGDTFAGWFVGSTSWEGQYGPTSVWLFRSPDGENMFHWGGRSQLDKKLSNLTPGDRVAIKREEDAPPSEGRTSGAWRVRVATAPGEGMMPEARAADAVAVAAAEPTVGPAAKPDVDDLF
jgi:hypothetical protein